ncbi:MAG: ABC transporter permease [Actinomycetota bacterium]
MNAETLSQTRTCALVGLQGLRARPLRTFLAVLSLLIGIVSVVCVWAASAIAERAVVARAELQSGRAGTFSLDVPQDSGALGAVRSAVHDSSGAAVTVQASAALGVEPSLGLSLIGVDGDLRSIRPFPIVQGNWLDDDYRSSRAPHLVLNKLAAERIGRGAITRSLRLGSNGQVTRPLIWGVVDDGSQEEAVAYLRLEELLFLDPVLERAPDSVAVFSGERSPEAVTAQSLLAASGVVAGPLQRSDQVENLRQEVANIRNIFAFISVVALIVGCLAVLNIGLATIGERVDELALRRAVGMRARLLAVVVLVESAIVGLLSSGLALAFTVPLLKPVAFALFPALPGDTIVEFPWTAALIAASSGCLASILGGLTPAARAARIPIAHVMRA